jgi:hypothetical protein
MKPSALRSSTPTPVAAARSWRPLTEGCLLFCLVFLVYVPSLSSSFIWDDDDYVTENRTLLSLGGLRQIWLEPSATPQYYPLVFTTFWTEQHLWGLNPTGYHLVNSLLHAANAVGVWLILRRLSIPGAWLAAARRVRRVGDRAQKRAVGLVLFVGPLAVSRLGGASSQRGRSGDPRHFRPFVRFRMLFLRLRSLE